MDGKVTELWTTRSISLHRGWWIRQREGKNMIIFSTNLFSKSTKQARTRRSSGTLWTPLEGINSWWGWRRSCAWAHSTWSRREQGAQPAEHRVHGEHGNLLHPTCSLQGLGLFWFCFSQGHAALKGKELKAWEIQEVKGPVSIFLKCRINRR